MFLGRGHFIAFFVGIGALSLLLPAICNASEKEATSQKNFLAYLEKFSFSGWAEIMQGQRLQQPTQAISSRVRLHLETEADFNWLYGFASVAVEKNWIISSETDVKLQELWLEHVGDEWDIRVGRQIIIWGKADGVQITDVITPPDLTEAMTRELEETR